MSHLRISLFGGFNASLDGEPITAFGADKTRALLAYLAVESARPHRRSELAALLWPDSPAAKAAHNLSQTLLRLRRALREVDAGLAAGRQPFLLITSQDIQFNPLSDHWLDVAEFAELIRAQQQHHIGGGESCTICIEWLRQAASLFRGDLLTGFTLRDSVSFEEWQVVQQEALRIQAIDTLDRLAGYYELRGEPEQVQGYARRLVALEPWHEPAQLKLLAALAASGQAAAALEQFAAYSRLLATEFGMKPSVAARSLYDQIRVQRVSGQNAHDSGGQPRQPAAIHTVSMPALPGERRSVTALVCGRRLLGDAGAGDPEEELESLARCSVRCEAILARYGGQRQPRQGAECLVYFGYPMAYEDAALRAVHAGLAMAAATDSNYAHAIGIHSGVMASVEEELVGDTPSLARGCQQFAEPGSVWVTEDSERLVHEYFDCRAVGQQLLARSGRPSLVYRVEGKNVTRNRLDRLAGAQRLTPFVGRAQEIRQLAACLDELHRGQGQVITLCGEPGIGKSRLVWELQRLDRQSLIWLESSCSPYFQNTGLYPLISLLEQLLDFQPGDDGRARRAKLDGTLERLDLRQPAIGWHLALLLGLPIDTPAPQTISEDQRERMRAAFVALIGRLAARQPLVIVIEDLHWADPSTLAWLDASLDALAAARCLVLLTYRPTLTPPWRPRQHLLELSLGPLSLDQVERLVDSLVYDAPVSDQIRHRVVAQADGIPLFAEEMARAVFEHSTQTVGNEVPATLRDSLWARLDRVGAAKVTAGWAAALGREFAYPLLAAIVPFDEPRVQADLAALIAAGLIQPVGDAAAARYAFRHALIQEAAHGSLLKRTRQAHHRRIAEIYATRFPQVAETQPEVMAEHYDQAGLTAQAVDCWLKAGEHAMTQGATPEALIFFGRALGAIEPEDRERYWRALWGRETVLFFRGERLAQKADIDALLALAESLDDTHRAQAQMRRARYASSQSDYHEQAEAADAAVAAARRADRPTVEVEALAYKVAALTRLGARSALPQVVEQTLAQAQQIDDDGIRSYAMAAVALYYLEDGDLAHAAQILSRSLNAARHAQSRRLDLESQYHGHLGFTYAQLGLYARARDALETGLELANVMGIGRYQAYQMLNLGFVHWRIGDLDTAIRMEETALQEYSATGEAYGQAVCRAYLGYMHEELGDLAAAAKYLAEARIGFAELDMALDRIEAQATEARVLLAQGQQEAARQLSEDVWRWLCDQEAEGLGSSAWVTMCVADVLDRVEIPGISAAAVLAAGHRELLLRADRINDAAWRETFLQNVAENRGLLECWYRSTDHESTQHPRA